MRSCDARSRRSCFKSWVEDMTNDRSIGDLGAEVTGSKSKGPNAHLQTIEQSLSPVTPLRSVR